MQTNKYLTISALTKYIKYKFESDNHLKRVFLSGEVSNFTRNSRGHLYFKIKDEDAQINAVMFKTNADKILFNLVDGNSILVEGYISVFPKSGTYQLYVNKIELNGIGNLHIEFENLKKRLHSEGYFEYSNKKTIPKYPNVIGVCTSPTGAAVKDIINTIQRRYPISKILIYPTVVQGEQAKYSIVKNIVLANQQNKVDVLIVGRGGGSIEDLWSFNEEIVAKAIYDSNIPIISTVGHETDTTISDYVADLRAPTPTAGAELAVPNKSTILRQLTNVNNLLNNYIINTLKKNKEKILRIEDSYIFRDPNRLLSQYDLNLDNTMLSLNKNFKIFLSNKKFQLKNNENNYKNILKKPFVNQEKSFSLILNKLEILNPLNLMKKGYSISKVNGKSVKTIKNISVSSEIKTYLSDGIIISKVTELKEK